MTRFLIGGQTRERVEVEVHGYERAPTGEYYDDNWLRCSISVAVGAFSGKFDAAFQTADFLEFRDQLQALFQSLADTEVRFQTLEQQLSLVINVDDRGGVRLAGVAVDAVGMGNRLEFELALDQSYLHSALEGLNDIVSRFPIRMA